MKQKYSSKEIKPTMEYCWRRWEHLNCPGEQFQRSLWVQHSEEEWDEARYRHGEAQNNAQFHQFYVSGYPKKT